MHVHILAPYRLNVWPIDAICARVNQIYMTHIHVEIVAVLAVELIAKTLPKVIWEQAASPPLMAITHSRRAQRFGSCLPCSAESVHAHLIHDSVQGPSQSPFQPVQPFCHIIRIKLHCAAPFPLQKLSRLLRHLNPSNTWFL